MDIREELNRFIRDIYIKYEYNSKYQLDNRLMQEQLYSVDRAYIKEAEYLLHNRYNFSKIISILNSLLENSQEISENENMKLILENLKEYIYILEFINYPFKKSAYFFLKRYYDPLYDYCRIKNRIKRLKIYFRKHFIFADDFCIRCCEIIRLFNMMYDCSVERKISKHKAEKYAEFMIISCDNDISVAVDCLYDFIKFLNIKENYYLIENLEMIQEIIE